MKPRQPADAVGLIQARMSSTRLPGKVLRSYAGSTVLDRVVRQTESFCQQAVVCTSIDPSDDPIEGHCASRGVLCIRGPLADVFGRFRGALDSPSVARLPWFFRITADCPLLCAELGRAMLRECDTDVDYVWYDDDELPRGISAELVRRRAFESIDPRRIGDAEREHVTVGLRERAEFKALRLPVPKALAHPELRLTLDYPEDARLLEELWSVDAEITAERAVDYLLGHPELARINQGCRQTPVRPNHAN